MADLVPLSLWMTDRSRYETGTGHCARDRYLSYHAGPHGYGWAKRAQSIPLVTGTSLAQIQEALHRQILVDGGMVPDEATYYRWIQQAVHAYEKTVADRGLTNVVDAAELALRTREQLTLLEGLAWVWYYVGLPALLDRWTIIGVEDEETSVLGCTCGLGDRIGTPEEHDARECQGIVYMTRGDLICQAKDGSGRYSYHEFKAPSETNVNTDAAWEYRVQLLTGVIGAEDRRGIRIDEIYLQQLIKGKRQAEWDKEQRKAVGPKFQNSALVYGWRRMAQPPLVAEDWRVKYDYVDELGKNRRLTKDYSRTPIWEMTFEPGGGALSVAHAWVQWLGYDELINHYRPLGPIQRNDDRRDQALRQIVGEENRWKEILWHLYRVAEETGEAWGSPRFMEVLDALVPQNRGQACHSYYGEPCSKLKLCDKLPGWEQPELLGYIPRRPHHVGELNQAIGRGLLPPEDGLAETLEE